MPPTTLAHWTTALMLTVVACGDSDSPSGGGGGSEPQGGAGGAPNEQVPADEAATPEECFWNGGGGSNGYYCDVFTAALSTPVAAEGLTATVTTSIGAVTFDDAENPSNEFDPYFAFISDPVERIVIVADGPGVSGEDHYDPEWVEIELQKDGATIGSARFERLQYTCHDYTMDDWCWEAAPVTLEITQ